MWETPLGKPIRRPTSVPNKPHEGPANTQYFQILSQDLKLTVAYEDFAESSTSVAKTL